MRIVALMLILSAVSLTAMETGIDGKWTTEMHMKSADGQNFTNKSTFTLKNDGGVLTGTVESNGGRSRSAMANWRATSSRSGSDSRVTRKQRLSRTKERGRATT